MKGFQGPLGEPLYNKNNNPNEGCIVTDFAHVLNGVFNSVFYFKRFNQLSVPFVQVTMVILGHQDSGAQSDQTVQRRDQEEQGILAILDLKGTKVGGLKKRI